MSNPLAPFLVRIFSQDDKIIGAGFLVTDRYALTCVHVVADALGINRNTQDPPTKEIKIDFPLIASGQKLKANISSWLPLHSTDDEQPSGNEDIALLEILDKLPAGCHPAKLVSSDVIAGTEFSTFGFPKNYDKGQPADGVTKGSIDGGCVVIEDPAKTGYFVEPGFSGAPVWSNDSVIGMIVSADKKSLRTAYMIPTSLLWTEVMKAVFAFETKFPVELSQSLIDSLTDVSSEDWQSIYARFRRNSFDDFPSHILLTVLNLFTLNDPAKEKGFEFVAALSKKFNKQSLTDWMIQAKQYLNLPAGGFPTGKTKASLLFQVEPLPVPPDSFHLHAWLWQGQNVEKLTDTNESPRDWSIIADEIQGWVTLKRIDHPELVVELALPRNSFCCDITQWELSKGETLLRTLPVSFRCLKRFNERRQKLKEEKHPISQLEVQRRALEIRKKGIIPVLLKDWETKCLKLQEVSQSEAIGALYHLDPQQDINDLGDNFRSGQGLFVAFGYTPDSVNETANFWRALDYGAPLVVWFREHPNGEIETEQELLATLELDNVKLGDLPKHIWELQKRALKKNDRTELHHHLTILYDDFERVPDIQ